MSNEHQRRYTADPKLLTKSTSFSSWMDRCLYDSNWGYYASGNVEFGVERHFWTYPDRMSPVFGWMVAEMAREALMAIVALEDVPTDAPLTLLELGGGDGALARDVMDYVVAQADDDRWYEIAPRIRYVLGDRSGDLRRRQKEALAHHIDAGRAEVREIDASKLTWDGEFYGVVIANELIDAFAAERLIVEKNRICRVHVAAQGDDIWTLDDIGRDEWLVDLADGWWEPKHGALGDAPDDLTNHLEHARPFIDDLAALDRLPVDMLWSPHVGPFCRQLTRLLGGPDCYGVALLIDYGGTTRHVLDPGGTNPHLRVYGPDGDLAHTSNVYGTPGQWDITWDVDFSEVARHVEDGGLEVHLYAHQSCLEADPIDLWAGEARRKLLEVCHAEGHTNEFMLMLHTHGLVKQFRAADGFRLMAVGSPELAGCLARFGEGDDVHGLATHTVVGIDGETLVAALEEHGLDPAIADALHEGGEVLSDLRGQPWYDNRAAVFSLLRDLGWLAGPGEVSGKQSQEA